MKHELLEERTTGAVIRCFYRVYDRLGFGYLESVYANALALELAAAGIPFEREVLLDVWYAGKRVGHFRADFLVASRVVVELKTTHVVSDAERAQLLNYLRCSRLEIGLLLHFGQKPAFHRMIYTNERKPDLPKPV